MFMQVVGEKIQAFEWSCTTVKDYSELLIKK